MIKALKSADKQEVLDEVRSQVKALTDAFPLLRGTKPSYGYLRKKAIIHQFSPDDTDLYLADKFLNITPKIEEIA